MKSTTKYYLQDSDGESWGTIASAPTGRYPTFEDLVEYAEKIRDNVRSQPGRTYDGGHRIIAVHELVAWEAIPDSRSYTENCNLPLGE